MKKINIIIFLIPILFLTIFSSLGSIVLAETDGYPFANAYHPSSENDGWGFYKRQCVSYVAYKANAAGVAFNNGMTGPNGTSGWFGNASNWDTNASKIGYVVNNTPAIGAIIQWNENVGDAGSAGHVGWVKNINSDGSVFFGEYNWNWGDGNYNTRTTNSDSNPSNYIHLNGNSCGGSNVTINNQTITTSLNCSASNSITISPETTIQPGSSEIRFYIQ